MKTNQFVSQHRGDDLIAGRIPGTTHESENAFALHPAQPAPLPGIALAGKVSAARQPVGSPAPGRSGAVETVIGALIAAACYFVLSQPAPATAPTRVPAASAEWIASQK